MKVERSYYFKHIKFIRDLANDYINVTKFQLELIDTIPFQRLKDVRQLTCQHVYPCARHTRFEHSLGVMELTRRAINNLNRNGFITNETGDSTTSVPISENNQFNAEIAALLHDVGHCPFSHLGEAEFDKEEVWEYFLNTIENSINDKALHTMLTNEKEKVGSVHEQLSCIIILKEYYKLLMELKPCYENEDDTIDLNVDLELIVRCIIGYEYEGNTKDIAEKNLLIRLINSSVFDMDKLDYIIRDSLYTGIGTPVVDTHRLFRNMYVTEQYTLLFTSKAVPALQNMIEARDNLYMYVYNHHTAVLSDFLCSYIQRRMTHTAQDLSNALEESAKKNKIEISTKNILFDKLGVMPQKHFFSVDSVIKELRSDSDWISLLNKIAYTSMQLKEEKEIIKALEEELELFYSKEGTVAVPLSNEEQESLSVEIQRIFNIVYRYQKRSFLKPWWKTIFEFSNFINKNFPDDIIREQLCELICDNKDIGPELRSQIAKHVSFIANKTFDKKFERLEDGDFFIVQRSVRFLELSKIEKLDIALKSNEIIGTPIEADKQLREYYVKKLTNIIPQKDFYSFYSQYSFYIYSKPLKIKGNDAEIETNGRESETKKYYKKLEEIFVFVATELLRNGKESFREKYIKKNNEVKSKKEFLEKYKKFTIM